MGCISCVARFTSVPATCFLGDVPRYSLDSSGSICLTARSNSIASLTLNPLNITAPAVQDINTIAKAPRTVFYYLLFQQFFVASYPLNKKLCGILSIFWLDKQGESCSVFLKLRDYLIHDCKKKVIHTHLILSISLAHPKVRPHVITCKLNTP